MTIQQSAIVTLIDGVPTTTSLAIADGAELQHKNVLELIRTYLADLEEFGRVAFKTRPRLAGQHGGGNTEYAILNEQQTTLIFTYMRNSEIVRVFKKRLVKEFYDLAHGKIIDPLQALNDPATMRGLLLTYTEKVITLEHQVEELQPKADALDRISAGRESMTLTQASKVLGITISKLTRWMHAHGWIYRQNGSWVGYELRIRAGLLEYKEAHYTDAKTGLACIKPYCHITPKGMAKLAHLMSQEVAA